MSTHQLLVYLFKKLKFLKLYSNYKLMKYYRNCFDNAALCAKKTYLSLAILLFIQIFTRFIALMTLGTLKCLILNLMYVNTN